eukprot:5344411-Alexandrium_andersonii.AAC.1
MSVPVPLLSALHLIRIVSVVGARLVGDNLPSTTVVLACLIQCAPVCTCSTLGCLVHTLAW